MSLTTDPDHEGLRLTRPNGQQEVYLILSPEETAKGYVRPLRSSYRHLACGCVTTMAEAIAMTYARQPSFYGGTFCVTCGMHFSLREFFGDELVSNFVWLDHDGNEDGSFVGE